MTAIPSGTTFNLEFDTTYQGWSDPTKNGQSVKAADVASARFLLKTQTGLADGDAKVSKTNSGGITLADGKQTVAFSPSDTKDLNGFYFGTLRLFLAAGGTQDWQDSSGNPYVKLEFRKGSVAALS